MSGFSEEVQCDLLGRYFLISFRQSQYVLRRVIPEFFLLGKFPKNRNPIKRSRPNNIRQTNFLHGFV
ncbi:hypothetical protein LEP1GSC036_3169 [Leptospira weilii str. 2006001853]|uniref:Uncharacterized protein n=3 Tax=Leptospira weilii TaxID=28184 RepID=A0A828YZ71_9LEPT|nr:hypothetical protein LEP1GSC036_3169 [Leptospira weilii str. 2006001853]EMJ60884.1 hypothetical protein LEP1GSC051_2688 [Leptospira sp. P2653]EMM72479.1 hypothetical protein LEP1GSC038_3350 [Leptospira weilii str. 2006001855]EMN90996.1 hypothetical protein LEP1GSC108_4343 [Leptospira weilii str. UI 13098]OMI17655.1 hypothetical protein BUQ74_08925 [Leptospira weilii serovar Heyan]